jgi:hypothetical protein
MGSSYMRSVVDRKVVKRHITVLTDWSFERTNTVPSVRCQFCSSKGWNVTRYSAIIQPAAHDLEYGPNIDFHSVSKPAAGSTRKTNGAHSGPPASAQLVLHRVPKCSAYFIRHNMTYGALLLLPSFALSRMFAQPVARRPPVARDSVMFPAETHLMTEILLALSLAKQERQNTEEILYNT